MQVEVTGELDELMENDDWSLIFGSDGKEFKLCLAQKAPKSLKSDL